MNTGRRNDTYYTNGGSTVTPQAKLQETIGAVIGTALSLTESH